jgi:hypothetical protein
MTHTSIMEALASAKRQEAKALQESEEIVLKVRIYLYV